MAIGPDWLQRVSDFMPVRWIVDAVRDTFVGELSWTMSRLSRPTSRALILVALGLATWWGTSIFRDENA